MSAGPTRILLIEDNPGDAHLLERMLEQARELVYELTWVDNLTDGITHLQTRPTDVLLLDLGLPERAVGWRPCNCCWRASRPCRR